MKLDFNKYKDKVKACWIGKNIGGTMGAPYERERKVLDIKGFSTPPSVVLPNDDLDLQLVWLFGMEQLGYPLSAATLGDLWIGFIPPHWNEYGICKANMKRGIPVSAAGDYENSWKNSNGAWIRTEIWACIAPGMPEVAVKCSVEDAKVDHGAGEGTFSAAFVAAMQSAAFIVPDIKKCIDIGLSVIPENSRTAKSIKLAIDCYNSKKSWLDARNTILESNMDIGNGWFEAPSNVAYAVIGLLYGEGDFKKTMITAINCGDDTDCTAATVGATLGILYGTEGIPSDWAEYIGDDIVTGAVDKSGDAVNLPKTCTELTERVTELSKYVLYRENSYVRKTWDGSEQLVQFSDKDEIPEDVVDLLKNRLTRKSRADWQNLNDIKPYSMRFDGTFVSAEVYVDNGIEIAPFEQKKISVRFIENRAFENMYHVLSVRFIMPEGFSVSGKKNVLLTRCDDHDNGLSEVDYVIQAGENVAVDNRIIIEISADGRPSPLYASFLLLGK